MISLETERLVLRNFQSSDLESLHTMILKYEASGMAAYDQQWPTSPEDIKGVVNWFASGDQYHAVCLKEGSRFIGFVAINPETDEGSRVYNLGYIFQVNYQGKGYASEACRAVLQHAFHSLKAERVIAGTAALNLPSCKLLEKLGFQKTEEGTSSFRNSKDGKPLEFLGRTYTLTRAAWEMMGEVERQSSNEFRGGCDTK
jgi:[ribosomal protein S5]-alanine N-acetyltransferase